MIADSFPPPGNQTYRDWAWDAFVAINSTCRVGHGFSSITDVNAPGGGSFSNEQESFLFAEVMKYSYLIQTPVSFLLLFLPILLLVWRTSVVVVVADRAYICRGVFGISTIMARMRLCSIRRRIRSRWLGR